MIDQFSVSLMTALVVVVCGTLFIVDTLFRRRDPAGHIWALGYLAAILTTLLYLVWAWAPETWWATAGGNAAFVIGTGAMWVGCARFNDRPVRLRATIVAGAGALAAIAAALEWYPGAGDWAGALFMFVPIGLFAALACVECFRGELGANRSALPLGLVFGAQTVYYLARTVVLITEGTESDLFHVWFGTFPTSLVTVVLSITAVVTTSILRATRSGLLGDRKDAAQDHITAILPEEQFVAVLRRVSEKARPRGDLLAVTVVRLEGLEDIATAFGPDVADEHVRAWRRSVLEGSPSIAPIGEIAPDGLGTLTVVASPAEARRQAMALHRSLFEALGSLEGGAIPSIGIGVVLSDTAGYDVEDLLELGRGTAGRAATGGAAAVLLADPS
ncbi:hypothetical protein [Microbacterium terricola]|uniref:GGDEF domain-containing protein n=1 Tax=Microbacterium terricola TaxID=344163 RepID=A0ABM8DY43_9MICO|nr:hypothetical protein [Microbacterium terricola]UYK38858.1 hypothetical protein OAU46_09065 [Microbacterium terricola]BDV30446.1 hypothetical protein Microterr_11060 [Microbacterium terricola]